MQEISGKRSASRRRWVAVTFVLVLILSACDAGESATTTSSDPTLLATGAPPPTPIAGSTTTNAVATTSAATEVTTSVGETNTLSSTSTTGTVPTTSTTSVGSTSSSTPAPGPGTILHHTGFRLNYPAGWHEAGIVISTQFAAEAECAAALIIDQAPPSDPAQAGFVLQSGVQVCARLADGISLDSYMASVYGTGVPGFERIQFAGRVAYRRDDGLQSLIFTQTDSYRFQVATFVAADPELEKERQAQVNEILAGLALS